MLYGLMNDEFSFFFPFPKQDCSREVIVKLALSSLSLFLFVIPPPHPHHNFVPSRSADQSGSGSVVPEMYIVEVMGGGSGVGEGDNAGSGAWSIRHVSSQKRGGGGEAEKGTGCRFNAPHLQEFAAL